MTASPRQATSNPALLAFRFFSSFGLAVVVLSLLLVITYLGTISQTEMGLLDSQRLYFDSWGVFHDFKIGRAVIPVWLPGGMLLMVVLFINMACGAVIRMRKGIRTIGVLISHLSIMFMLAAGWVSFQFKTEGAMPLFEGQASDLYQSYHDRVVEIQEYDEDANPMGDARLIPMDEFMDLAPGKARTFYAEAMPFDLQLTGYQRNASIVASDEADSAAVDGYRIQPAEHNPTDEQNLSAIVAVIDLKDGNAPQRAILWEGAFEPYSVKAGEKTYALAMTRRKWKLPFALRLEDFQRELHPGTQKAKRYTSYVTKIADGAEQEQIITMNVPLRDQNFVVYQASFSQSTSGEQSVFTVASNPSDQWPLWSCVAVGFGLTLHFVMSLARFLGRRKAPKSPLAGEAPATA